MNTIQLDWESPDEAHWRDRLAKCGRSTMFQSWSWGRALEATGQARVRRAYIQKNGRPVGLVQVFEETRLGLFTLGRILRGPLFFQSVLPEDRIAAMKEVRRAYPLGRMKRLSILPELPDGPAVVDLLRNAGFHKVLKPYETAWLDLSLPLSGIKAAMRQNFRNQLRRATDRATAGTLTVAEVEDPRPLLTRYDRHRKKVGYAAPSGMLLGALTDSDRLCLEARMGDDVIAGVLFVMHGQAATYQIGWTSPDGRAIHAHNLLLWRGIETLQQRGIRFLDLGGLDWDSAPGVAHFKAGIGGEAFTLPGTYV
ncbi:GNAT family N-acetyltransferase [Rhodospirillaceae bacterium KN72]|uniref:GNAT family N-acetyltransferase n=1 Tax=Pacificispira spongiicola TaxID=2729598 RepID=A0A7Y0E2S9_9PROT|nr:GNAT family N-acetyltransferase [Pacificispira spongiicola]NMM46153.1 GNAT family N-acetyltransferase [Pacificispira spongiicola]